MTVLELSNVSRLFGRAEKGGVLAVDDVSLRLEAGKTLALIGESGSGKSTLGRIALGLIEATSGDVHFEGSDITAMDIKSLRSLRPRMQIVFQEPYQSLNPRRRIGQTLEEPLRIHFPTMSAADRRDRVLETLDQVGLPVQILRQYPRALSGGQQQRVGIARAVITRPSLVVLDEPTSSLDLSVRAQILNLLESLQAANNVAYLFISHDIATVRHVSHKIAVMYLGRIVEYGPTASVMDEPKHPYTKALLSAGLSPDPRVMADHFPLTGEVRPRGVSAERCVLVGRCPIEIPDCSAGDVELAEVGEGRLVACLKA